MTRTPDPRSFTPAPLRNRVRVALMAPVADVWALLGDPARLPEYSAGLERVEATWDHGGRCTAYVCHFRPREAGAAGIVHREAVRWYEPGHGYASSCEGASSFGLSNDVNLVTVERSDRGTLLVWDVYFDSQDLDAGKSEFDQALADIGERLVRRFGGEVIERYVEP